MWVKTTCCNYLCLLLIRKLCLQFCTSAVLYHYAGFYLQKATTFSRSPASLGRELQPPSSCTSRCVYWYICTDLQKATSFSFFFQGPHFINFQIGSINNIISNISASTNYLWTNHNWINQSLWQPIDLIIQNTDTRNSNQSSSQNREHCNNKQKQLKHIL